MAVGQVINSILTIICMGLPGFVLGKTRKIDEMCDGLTYFAVNVCVPALIVKSLQVEYTSDLLLSLGKTFAYTVPQILFAGILAIVYTKICKYSKQRLSILFSILIAANTGFVGIPLCLQLYGEESMFYAAACEIVNDLLMYSVVLMCIAMASGSNAKMNMKEIFLNPPIVALVVGVTLFISKTMLPSFIGNALGYFSGATAPLLLFVLGSRLSKLSARDFVCDWTVYGVCALRLIVMPIFTYLLVRVFFGEISLFSKVFILMSAMPAGAVISMLSINYKSDADFAVKGVTLSTVLCILTAPVWALIL